MTGVVVNAPTGNDTNFIQNGSGEFVISEKIGGVVTTLPGKIIYGGTTTFFFNGNAGNDSLILEKLSDFLSVGFVGGAGNDYIGLNDYTTYDKRYTLDRYYTGYNTLKVAFEVSPGAWSSQPGTLRFNLSGDTIETVQVYGNEDDSMVMNDLLLGTAVGFTSGVGSELIVDLDGETVAASGTVGSLNYVQYTDGTTTYAPIYYSSVVTLTTV